MLELGPVSRPPNSDGFVIPTHETSLAFEKTASWEKFSYFTLYLDFGRHHSILIVLRFFFLKIAGLAIGMGLHVHFTTYCFTWENYLASPILIFINKIKKEDYFRIIYF